MSDKLIISLYKQIDYLIFIFVNSVKNHKTFDIKIVKASKK